MLETPHIVVGAAIATYIPNPLIALPLAFGSHFLLEKVPHWNPHLNTEIKKHGKVTRQSTLIVAGDVILSLFLGFTIASRALPNTNHFIVILLACFFSILPDLVEGPYFFLGINSKFVQKWIKFQKSIQADANVIPGLITQVITVFIALWWIYF
ncbi:hypothetical protein ACFL0F_01925 [Patescibacteria group bacterium]